MCIMVHKYGFDSKYGNPQNGARPFGFPLKPQTRVPTLKHTHPYLSASIGPRALEGLQNPNHPFPPPTLHPTRSLLQPVLLLDGTYHGWTTDHAMHRAGISIETHRMKPILRGKLGIVQGPTRDVEKTAIWTLLGLSLPVSSHSNSQPCQNAVASPPTSLSQSRRLILRRRHGPVHIECEPKLCALP